ncbi:MAG TPA: hypothetical protein VIM14_16285 [Polyangia bacterium]
MPRLLVLVSLLVPSLGIFGCGGSSRPTTGDDGHGHGASYACGTEQAPVTLVLKDVAPEVGATVPNRTIVQQFTVVDPPFIMDKLTFVFLPKHTAGTPSPSPLQLTVVAQGKDQVYSATIDAWSTAPGHVEMGVDNVMANNNGCVFIFPSTLFSYEITSP